MKGRESHKDDKEGETLEQCEVASMMGRMVRVDRRDGRRAILTDHAAYSLVVPCLLFVFPNINR
jgi:hypothetical protein